MKNPFYTILTPVLVLGATLLGFVLLKPAEPTAFYWINLAWVATLELLFFFWMRWGHLRMEIEEKQTNPFGLFLGTSTLYYIIACVVWMLFFYFTEERLELSHRLYLVVLVVLTALWVLLSATMGRHDVANNEQQTQLENNTLNQREFVAQLKAQAAEYQTEESKRAWATLIREAESVPPAQFASKADAFTARAEKLTQA